MSLRLPSPAKLNLFLYIIGQRHDGYHLLQTLFQFLDYGDTLTFTPRQDGQIRLLTPVIGVKHEENLIVRAAQLLQKSTGSPLGADIEVEKKLPMGSGLGGGSSNAATVLLGLNYLWQTGWTLPQLAALGLSLGADVPLFVHGQAVFAEGIGEQFQPAEPAEKWYLVAHPGITIPTSLIFADPNLCRNSPVRTQDQLLVAPFTNDCESIARKRFPEVEQLISWLLHYAPSRLTGTGACVFAEFDTESAARQVLKQAPEWIIGFVAHGVNVSPLHNCLSRLAEVRC